MVTTRPATKMSILLVDGHVDCADSLCEVFGLYGHTVTVARSFEVAMRVAATDPQDVLIVEPGPNSAAGYMAVSRLRTALADPFTIAVTAGGRTEDRLLARAAGVDLLYVKPVAPGTLRAALERCMSGLAAADPMRDPVRPGGLCHVDGAQ